MQSKTTTASVFANLLLAVALLISLIKPTPMPAATYNTLVIAAADQAAANLFWYDQGAGENNFTVALVPYPGPADATATHYISSGQFERYFPGSIFSFTSAFPSASSLVFVGASAGNAAYVNAWIASHGLQRRVVSPL